MEAMFAPSAIAVDIGGTNTRVALVRRRAEAAKAVHQQLELEIVAAFPTELDYDCQIERLASEIAAARASAAPRHDSIAGLGISVGGQMARDGSGVSIAPNLPSYQGRQLRADLSERTGLAARAAHDTVCGLLGELRYGALRGSERCAYLTLSTGVGAAIHLAGVEDRPGVTVSIELGHQLLDGSSRHCLCGQTGCLETYVGGRQLEARYGAPLEQARDPQVWESFVDKLALGLVNLAHLTRVELVATGGAITLARPSLLRDLQTRVDARLTNASLRLVPAVNGARAPLIGAAALLDSNPAEILN